MNEMRYRVSELFDGLYSEQIIDEVSRITGYYLGLKKDNPTYKPLPKSLHGVTSVREISDPVVEAPKNLESPVFKLLGITDGKTLKGPLNHIITRFITIPRMLKDYIDNYPDEKERKIYQDPPLLHSYPTELKKFNELFFEQAGEKLRNREEIVKRFKILGEVGEEIAQVENAYPATNSTEAYELFGIFHLFPSNKTVDVTSTSPGIILPTEADPLRFKDTLLTLKKNLLRPTYFEMLRLSPELGNGRKRRYFASEEGTRKNLQEYGQFIGAAKEILQGYLNVGDRFEIKIGIPSDKARLTTLIGDIGVVYSIRDKEEKGKIAHNVTIINPEEARRHRKAFETEQWNKGKAIDSLDIIDELVV